MNPVTCVLIRLRQRKITYRESDVRSGAEIEVMGYEPGNARERWQSPEARREAWNAFCSRACGGSAHTLVMDFGPLDYVRE